MCSRTVEEETEMPAVQLSRYEGGHPAYPVIQTRHLTLAPHQEDVAQYAGASSPLFTKRHFEAFAKHINSLHAEGDHVRADAVHNAILRLNDNPKFSPSRFAHAATKGTARETTGIGVTKAELGKGG
jgi:hypothetical protein